MFTLDAIILISLLVGMTALGSYWSAKSRYIALGIEIGAEITIDTLVEEGYLAVEIDSDGDEALVTIKKIKEDMIKED